jgi:DNA repair exonuclease SbcCD ATPase subunit
MKVKEPRKATKEDIELIEKSVKENRGKYKCRVCGKKLDAKKDIIVYERRVMSLSVTPVCFECIPEDVQVAMKEKASRGEILKDYGENMLMFLERLKDF